MPSQRQADIVPDQERERKTWGLRSPSLIAKDPVGGTGPWPAGAEQAQPSTLK